MRFWLVATSCLVLSGCRCRPPPTIVCDDPRYFVAPDFQLTPGRPPAPPTRRGQAIPLDAIEVPPTALEIKDPTHVELSWVMVDFYFPEPVIYSPQEQAGRSESRPGTIYWMRRTTTGSADVFEIGFMSKVCDDPEAILHDKYCSTFTRDRRPLVAELTCREDVPAR
jgi:hypothetical protein